MQTLLTKLNNNHAITKPATVENVTAAENALSLKFSLEYKEFLTQIGTVSFEDKEIFGLGIPENVYLNIVKATKDLREFDNSFPMNAVPLFDIGDGHYYLYDNHAEMIVLWATPNGGIQKTIAKSLENFLLELLFN